MVLLGFVASANVFAAGPAVLNTTLVTGPDPHLVGPTNAGARVADLDNGFVAGVTRYVYGGFIQFDTHAPFLWAEKDNSATLFKLPDSLATTESFYLANAMTPDGTTVVGSVIFLDEGTTAPWVWTRSAGLEFLKLPTHSSVGGAVAVTKNGRLIAGLEGGVSSPGHAVVWRDRVFAALPSRQLWSEIGSAFEPQQPLHQRPMTIDGKIIVGATGPGPDQMQATKWVDGVEQGLFIGHAISSVAMFVTDSGVIFGTGTFGDGRVLMLRWDAGGNLQTLEPPDGLSVVNLSSVDTLGNAAGGALAERVSCVGSHDPACNRAPFVWTNPPSGPLVGIFTVLPEAGLENFYDLSTVADVSDDGLVVVGALTAGSRTDGDPRDVAFLWTEESGLVLVNDIMKQRQPDYYSADRVSRDGNRVLVTGNPPQATEHDTKSLILDLKWPGDSSPWFPPKR